MIISAPQLWNARLTVALVFLLVLGGCHRPPSRPLLQAVARDDVREVKRLLLAGVNPNEANPDGWTALMYAVQRRNHAIARMLVQSGADVNAADKTGWTPLMTAAWTGDLEMVRFIVESGARVMHRDERGRTALDIARVHHHSDIVAYLESVAQSPSAPGSKSDSSPPIGAEKPD